METTINDSFQPLSGIPVMLNVQIGYGQQSSTTVLLGTKKVLETLESNFSLELTQFKNPTGDSILRVRCTIQDTTLTGRSFVKFTLTNGTNVFDSQLPDNEIDPIGGFIVYSYRIHFI